MERLKKQNDLAEGPCSRLEVNRTGLLFLDFKNVTERLEKKEQEQNDLAEGPRSR